MKRIQKKKIIVIGLILCLISSVSVSFAWFITNANVSIQNANSYTLEVGNSLKVSYKKSDGTWSAYKDGLELEAPYLQDVSSNGLTFYYPETLDLQDNALYPLTLIPDTDRYGKYVELYLKLKTKATFNLYLSDASFIRPIQGSSGNEYTKDKYKSLYGDFSTCFIAGAARVSVAEIVDEVEELRQIWIPNDKYQLNFDGYSASFYENGSRETNYGYFYNNTTTSKVERKLYSDDMSNFYSNFLAIGNGEKLANQNKNLIRQSKAITSFTNLGVDEEKQIVVRLWIEGSDRESKAPLNEGKIEYKISFCGIEKDDDTLESDNEFLSHVFAGENGLLYKDEDLTEKYEASDNIQYSYNFIDWNTYSVRKHQTLNIDEGFPYYYSSIVGREQTTEIVYIKQGETFDIEHSTIYKVNMKNNTIEKFYYRYEESGGD